MTEMVTSGSMSEAEKRSDGLLGENGPERTPFVLGAAGPERHRASPRLYRRHFLYRLLAGASRQTNGVRAAGKGARFPSPSLNHMDSQ
jgi:hypothetical protein